jgi:hypothetical protein
MEKNGKPDPWKYLKDEGDLAAAITAYKGGKDFTKFLKDESEGGVFTLEVDKLLKRKSNEGKGMPRRLPLLENVQPSPTSVVEGLRTDEHERLAVEINDAMADAPKDKLDELNKKFPGILLQDGTPAIGPWLEEQYASITEQMEEIKKSL